MIEEENEYEIEIHDCEKCELIYQISYIDDGQNADMLFCPRCGFKLKIDKLIQ